MTVQDFTISEHHYDYGAKVPRGRRVLARYAASAIASRGRRFDEAACPTRTETQRDRDRIIHASAFRRLMFKTQVFVYHQDDHFRTRLTHTLEVAQIARTIARQLCLDEDLAEAVALAHDLGHPPFGHAGERALDVALGDCGGFDHNVQSLRVVNGLERKYARFDGLNLSWESLEGLVKHNGPPALRGHPGDGAMLHALGNWPETMDLELSRQASAEAQVAAIADDIAWRTHDIDDGLRSGLIGLSDLEQVKLIQPILELLRLRSNRDPSRDIYEIVRQLITLLVSDVVAESRVRLSALEPETAEDIRGAHDPVVAVSADLADDLGALKAFLYASVYRHPRIMAVMDNAQSVIADLVNAYRAQPNEMGRRYVEAWTQGDARRRARVVGDFVGGMTDRFAIAEHERLFDVTPELS